MKSVQHLTTDWGVNSSPSQVIILKNSDLEGMCDRCDSKKTITTVHIRACARTRGLIFQNSKGDAAKKNLATSPLRDFHKNLPHS